MLSYMSPASLIQRFKNNTANMPRGTQGLVSADNDVDFEDTWHTLASSLREMHTKNASRLSFETIYRHAYKLVLKKKGGPLYERIQVFERLWLTDEVRTSLKKLLSPSLLGVSQKDAGAHMANERRGAGERFLQGVKQAFEDHQLVMNMATDVFMYLVRKLLQCPANPDNLFADFSRIEPSAKKTGGPQYTLLPCYCSETVYYVFMSPAPRVY